MLYVLLSDPALMIAPVAHGCGSFGVRGKAARS
jgi:hypothetical protein